MRAGGTARKLARQTHLQGRGVRERERRTHAHLSRLRYASISFIVSILPCAPSQPPHSLPSSTPSRFTISLTHNTNRPRGVYDNRRPGRHLSPDALDLLLVLLFPRDLRERAKARREGGGKRERGEGRGEEGGGR
jgi:hypothetical protein